MLLITGSTEVESADSVKFGHDGCAEYHPRILEHGISMADDTMA